MKSSSYIFSLLFCCTLLIPACQKEKDITCKEEIIEVKVSPSVPQVKAPNYVTPSLETSIYAFGFKDPQETEMSLIRPDSYYEGVFYYSVPADTDTLVFTNYYTRSFGYNAMFDCLSVTKDFDNDALVFERTYDLDWRCDLVAGGGCLTDTPEDGVLKVHLHRLTAFVSANLKLINPDKSELTFDEYIKSAYLAVLDQAKSVSCDAKGNVTISDIPYNNCRTSLSYSEAICIETPIFPTAQGMKGKIELHLTNHDNTETVLTKELNYPFERNKHYVLTLTVKRTDTAFGGFAIEDVVTETIDIQLN